MKLHRTHFSPHGLIRAYSHLVAGRNLCREANIPLLPLIPDSVNSMTTAWGVFKIFRDLGLTPPKTLIDIGANTSQMAKLLFSLNKNLILHSFEPNRHLLPMGNVHREALLNKNGLANLHLPLGDHSWGRVGAGIGGVSVETRRMDSLIDCHEMPWKNLPKPLFVKIDTEGNERNVLEGFGDYLFDVSYLLVEIENPERKASSYDPIQIYDLISRNGFNNSKIMYACYDGPDSPSYTDVFFWKG